MIRKIENENKNNIKIYVSLLVALLIIVTSLFIKGGDELSSEGIKTIGILLAFLVILITNALPIVVVSLLFVGLMALTKVTNNLGEALSGFSQPVVFFTLASFGLAAAFTTTPLSKRILKGLLKKFGKSINLVILSIMVCACLVSSIISNVPTCAVFMAISLNFLNLYQDEEDKKKAGKALMVAVPISSMIGGMMTPAGSSINLLVIGLLEDFNGTTISFVEWMACGIPLALIMLPIAWFLIIKIYKPVQVEKKEIDNFIESIDVEKKMKDKEIKTIIIASIMFILWILSSWISFFNVMVISILGCAVLFFPGINVLDVNTFLKENSWDAFFLVGTVLSIGSAMVKNGVISFISGLIPVVTLPTILFLMMVSLIVFLCLIILPVATSLVSILTLPLLTIGLSSGVSGTLIAITIALSACNCYLLPLDTVPLITYSKGYYTIKDMIKVTSILQVLLVIFIALWVSLIGAIF